MNKQTLEIIECYIKKGLDKEAIWDALYSKNAAPFVLIALREPFEEAYAKLYATHMAQGITKPKEYAAKYNAVYDSVRMTGK